AKGSFKEASSTARTSNTSLEAASVGTDRFPSARADIDQVVLRSAASCSEGIAASSIRPVQVRAATPLDRSPDASSSNRPSAEIQRRIPRSVVLQLSPDSRSVSRSTRRKACGGTEFGQSLGLGSG